VRARLGLDDHAVDPALREQGPEHQARRACADDRNLGTQLPRCGHAASYARSRSRGQVRARENYAWACTGGAWAGAASCSMASTRSRSSAPSNGLTRTARPVSNIELTFSPPDMISTIGGCVSAAVASASETSRPLMSGML